MLVMNINLRPKKCSGQSRYGRYSSYATGHGCICDIITPLSYRLHTYSQVWLTDTGRLTPRPHSISLTYTSTVSNQVVANITTVGCYLSQCCSIGMTNLAIRSGIQSSTVHNCSRPRKRVSSNIYVPKKIAGRCLPKYL